MLRIEGDRMELLGASGGRLFRPGTDAEELSTGTLLDELLGV